MAEVKQGKKNRKLGRAARHPSHVAYNHSHRREHNKIKRVLKSSGLEAAIRYAARCAQIGLAIKVPSGG